MMQQTVFSLENFEGSLDVLFSLIQKEELHIEEVPLRAILRQFSETNSDLDEGAEFIGLLASLHCLKSKNLLPCHEAAPEEETEADSPSSFLIQHLLDYRQFRDVARNLSRIEEKQEAFFFRQLGAEAEYAKPLGIEHLSLEDFASLFRCVLAKSTRKGGVVHEEEWRVADKIAWIRHSLTRADLLVFSVLFSPEMCREELIVTFLAVLELMKLGEILVARVSSSQQIAVFSVK